MSKVKSLNWQLESIKTQLLQIRQKVAVDLHQTELATAFNQLVTSFQELARLLTIDNHQVNSTLPASSRAVPLQTLPQVSNTRDRTPAEQQMQHQAVWLNVAPIAIFACDLDGYISFWNQAAERLYGWAAAEAIDQIALELLGSEMPQAHAEMMATLIQQGAWSGASRQKTKTGQVLTVESRWTVVRDELGQAQWLLAVHTDVTQKNLLEDQFYRAERLESLSRFASGIAHDLNNVLTPITVVSQLLRLQQSALDARFQEMLQVLEDGTKRGVTLIKQLLTFARGKDGESTLVAIAPLVQAVSDAVQESFPTSIQIQRSLPAIAPWQVLADPTYLHQVLMQLCLNACEAMPDGGTLSLSIESCYVDQISAQLNLPAQVGNYVVVTVGDTGIGMPIEVRDRMFEPFFTTKPPGQGTGLGLATTLGIIKNYGGFLQVCSEVGQGTQIKVYLPLSALTSNTVE